MPFKFSFSHAFFVLILLSTLLGGICYPFSLPGTFDTKTHLERRGSDVHVGLRYQESSAFYPLPARYWSFWLNTYGLYVKQEIEHDVFKIDILSEKRYHVGTSLGSFHINSSRRDLPVLTEELQKLPGQLWPVDCFNLIFENLKEKELMTRVPEDWTKLYNENLEMGAIQLKREVGGQIVPLFDNHVDPTEKWTIYIGTKHGFAVHSSPGKPSKFIETNKEFKGGILVDTIFTSKMHLDSILQEVRELEAGYYLNMDWIRRVLARLKERGVIKDVPPHFFNLYTKLIDMKGDGAGSTMIAGYEFFEGIYPIGQTAQ
ncbi:hypothetical protein F5876DRAFT_79541 [Lentinula aff. lateritia]|uniref:Uncharacterized protein n=1 Tax=Lentinula aff. lateritia TaxID=2804960 RepID=A0ACC1TS94_9AGAR|nr:hypothetical protein F5876DRAFT_79541 [Lentinula aff. lateritia]